MTEPRVTVCLGVRNGERFLAEAIESVLAQEGVAFLLRLYDNCSTDRTVEVAAAYECDPRFELVVNERDLGAYGNLNRGLAGTQTEYFVPLAADDRMLPWNLARKVAALDETGAAFAHGPILIIDDRGTRTGTQCPDLSGVPLHTRAPGYFWRLLPANSVALPATVVRTDALRGVGGFDERLPYCADFLAWMLLSLRHGVATVQEALFEYRVHADNGTARFHRAGLGATQVPAAVRRALVDPLFPAEWSEKKAVAIAASCMSAAYELELAGHLRADGGCSAYACVAAAVAVDPTNPALQFQLAASVERAGLHPPVFPLELISCEASPDDVPDLLACAAALADAGALARVAFATVAEEADTLAAALERALEPRPDIDVDLVVTDKPERLLAPGRALLAPLASPWVSLAEQVGVPVFPPALPDPAPLPTEVPA